MYEQDIARDIVSDENTLNEMYGLFFLNKFINFINFYVDRKNLKKV